MQSVRSLHDRGEWEEREGGNGVQGGGAPRRPRAEREPERVRSGEIRGGSVENTDVGQQLEERTDKQRRMERTTGTPADRGPIWDFPDVVRRLYRVIQSYGTDF